MDGEGCVKGGEEKRRRNGQGRGGCEGRGRSSEGNGGMSREGKIGKEVDRRGKRSVKGRRRLQGRKMEVERAFGKGSRDRR